MTTTKKQKRKSSVDDISNQIEEVKGKILSEIHVALWKAYTVGLQQGWTRSGREVKSRLKALKKKNH